MALRAVLIRDGAVTRYDVSGPASEVHVVRGDNGEVLVRIYDRSTRYGDSGSATELSTIQLATPGAAARIVCEEYR